MLTTRQSWILKMIADGDTTAAIAAREHLSVHTVRNHLAAARERLGARTLAHAVALAVKRELI